MRSALSHTDVCPGCAALAPRVELLEAELAALRRARAPRDAYDRLALKAVAVAADGEPWTAAELWRRAVLDDALKSALWEVDIESAWDLAIWCRGMRDVSGHGLQLRRLKRAGSGHRWIVVAEPSV